MWIRNLALAAFSATLLAVGAESGAVLPTPEEAIETGTDVIVLPRTYGGAIVTRACGACPALTLRLQEDSELLLGKERVTLPQLLRATDALRAPRRMTIFYNTRSKVITRLQVAG